MANKILLVEPAFPTNKKSKNHSQSLPIGLLKLASYHRSLGDEVKLVRGCAQIDHEPDKILMTSLFTYWSKYVWETVHYYKRRFPNAPVVVGGIYATLMPDHCRQSGCDEVYIGLHKEAEFFPPAYDLVDADFQIVNTSRGCPRKCGFCGVWRIEPQFTCKRSISEEICRNKVLFYDNNLLANPYIGNILEEIAAVRVDGRSVICESQCGIDGRLLTYDIARLLKRAHFLYPRIAWDHSYEQHEQMKTQIDTLVSAGYNPKDIYVFMLYNFELSYEEMDKKRQKCREWGVQIADCRYRPLNQTFDNYNPQAWKKGQTDADYYIHPNWTDVQVRTFRKQVREQNIVIRHGFTEYSRSEELAGRQRQREQGRERLCQSQNE
jgi:hypothetical protein